MPFFEWQDADNLLLREFSSLHFPPLRWAGLWFQLEGKFRGKPEPPLPMVLFPVISPEESTQSTPELRPISTWANIIVLPSEMAISFNWFWRA